MTSANMESTGTTLAASALEMCVKWAAVDKAHSWELANQLAKIDPFQLSNLPKDLTELMLKKRGG